MNGKLTASRQTLTALQNARPMQSPLNYYQDKRLLLDFQQKRLTMECQRVVNAARQRFIRLSAALDAMSPLKVLSRGYAIAQREDGGVVKSCGDVQIGELVEIGLTDGRIAARVTGIEQEERHGRVEDL